MRKLFPLLVLAAGLVFAATGSAITYGVPDGNRHPAVGALLAPTAYPDGTWAECTGTLIAPRVFLTAEHCDEGISRREITFATQFDRATSTTYWGTWHGDPAYNQAQSDPHDIAVIVLDRRVNIAAAQLPEAGSLSSLAQNQPFTSVGYGAQSVTNGAGGITYSYDDTRFVATGTLNAVNPAWLRISQNAATGDGGTCYGDSGGPNFLGAGSSERNVVAATTITGDSICTATNVVYRLDTPSARAFLGEFVTLP